MKKYKHRDWASTWGCLMLVLLVGQPILGAQEKPADVKVIETKAPALKDEAAFKELEKKLEAGEEAEMAAGKSGEWKPSQPAANEKVGSWTEVPLGQGNDALKFTHVEVGNADEVWAVGEDKKVYHLGPEGWQAEATGIAVGAAADGTVYAINENNDVFKRVSAGTWEQISGLKLTQLSIGDKQVGWGILKNKDEFEVFELKEGKWERAKDSQGEPASGFTYIAANAGGAVLAIDEKDKIFLRTMDRVAAIERTKGLRGQLKDKWKNKLKEVDTQIKELQKKPKKERTEEDKQTLRRLRRKRNRLKRRLNPKAKKKKKAKKGKKKTKKKASKKKGNKKNAKKKANNKKAKKKKHKQKGDKGKKAKKAKQNKKAKKAKKDKKGKKGKKGKKKKNIQKKLLKGTVVKK